MLHGQTREQMLEAKSVKRAETEAQITAWLESADTNLKSQFSNVPDLYRGLAFSSLTGKASRTQAIKAKCLECCCWQREEVRVCSIKTCPLNPIRPFQKSEVDSEDGD